MTSTRTASNSPDIPSGPIYLGFLTVLQEGSSYVGGYLVTNVWGRPLEFRLSSAVQPNKVQQILYGPSLQAYVSADLIGKTLVEKAGVAPHLVLTDCEAALDLRRKLEVPVLWLGERHGREDEDGPGARLTAAGATVDKATEERGLLCCHPDFLTDIPLVQALLSRVDPALDLHEPFGRIREAVAEARRMGVTSRAA